MRIVLFGIAGLALVGLVVVAYVLPQRAEAEAKDAAQRLIGGADVAKQKVSAVAAKAGKLAGAGADAKLAPQTDPRHGELKWLVEPDGVIRGWNEKNGIEISLRPILHGGKLEWACRGFPSAAMPAGCGGV